MTTINPVEIEWYAVSEVDAQKIEKAFTYHAPKNDQPEKYAMLRQQANDLAIKMCQLVPPSRELSLALTNLEQAVMWANAGIAINE